jgi:hypothetical protein
MMKTMREQQSHEECVTAQPSGILLLKIRDVKGAAIKSQTQGDECILLQIGF